MSEDPLDRLDYYTLLGVPRGAEVAEIRRAFRKFAQKYHPDRFAGAPAEKIERAQTIYRRGSEGFEVLTDPVARAAYDARLAHGETRLSADERDRAHAAVVASAGAAGSLVRSPQAMTHYRRAAEASRARDWMGAWRALRAALEHEPDNPEIKLRLEQVAARIKATGL